MPAKQNKKENELWESFEKTGSIEAFLSYRRVKSREEGILKGAGGESGGETLNIRETSKEKM
jgi:hypothetical protein